MTDRERPLRFVFFSPSVIADIDNPAATSTRALLGALSSAGHDVTHLERRGNSLLDRQLRTRGSAALRSLNARYPDIRIRQYDLPSGQQRNVWFGTEVSTADAVVALPGTSDEILALVAAFATPHLVRIVPPEAIGDVTFPDTGTLMCVERRERIDAADIALAVAYDNVPPAMTVDLPADVDRIVVGSSDLSGWRYLPEVEVTELYRSARMAIVLDGDDRPASMTRALLPVAAGCAVTAWPGRTGQARREPTGLSDNEDAALVANSLATDVRATLALKRREFADGLPGR